MQPNTDKDLMKKALSIPLVLLFLSFPVCGLAAERKSIPANPPAKKKVKGIPPAGVQPTATDGELTEEEKKFAKEMAAKFSKGGGDEERVPVPVNILVTQPPRLPELTPKAPPRAPKPPGSELIVRIPRAPMRIQQPSTAGPEKPPTAPKKQ